IAPGRLRLLAAAAWLPVEASEAPRSFSPARRTILPFAGTSHSVRLVALDSTDDGRVDYDRLLILPEAGARREARVGDWLPGEVPGVPGRAGAGGQSFW